MALTTQQRADLARQWAREFFVKAGATAGFSHQDLVDTVAAIDDKLDAAVNTLGIPGATALGAALVGLFSDTAMAAATTAQKSMVFSWVILKRTGVI
jgi:hypothetical protein